MNIEQALQLGFPPEAAPKLQSRREKCQAAQQREKGVSPASNKATETRDVSESQSDAITVTSSPELGRHMIVSQLLNSPLSQNKL